MIKLKYIVEKMVVNDVSKAASRDRSDASTMVIANHGILVGSTNHEAAMPSLPKIVREPTFIPRGRFYADEGLVFFLIEADGRRFSVYVADCVLDNWTSMAGDYTETQAIHAVAAHLNEIITAAIVKIRNADIPATGKVYVRYEDL